MLNKNWKPEVVIVSMAVVQFEIKTLIRSPAIDLLVRVAQDRGKQFRWFQKKKLD